MNTKIYDLECYRNFFLATFKTINENEYFRFEISDRINQTNELREFLLKKDLKLIGFNNINYDYPLLHNTILSNNIEWTAENIFFESQTIINTEYSAIWDNQTKIPQLDLFKIWHYDNKNKSTSLKWLEFAMRMHNVEDLPYHFSSILTSSEMDVIISYCDNDILATEKFYNLSRKHIEIRNFYSKKEKINLINASETKMAKEIFAKYLSKELGIDISELKKLRTYRTKVHLNEVIFDYIKFNDDINKKTLEKFNTFTKTEYNSLNFSVNYKNVVREYGEGGLHSFGKAGIYETDDEYIICDVDFKAE